MFICVPVKLVFFFFFLWNSRGLALANLPTYLLIVPGTWWAFIKYVLNDQSELAYSLPSLESAGVFWFVFYGVCCPGMSQALLACVISHT